MPRQISNADDLRRLIAALKSDVAHITQVATDDDYFTQQLKRLDEGLAELNKQRTALVNKREKSDELIQKRKDRIAVLEHELSLETNKGELNKLAKMQAKFEKLKAQQ